MMAVYKKMQKKIYVCYLWEKMVNGRCPIYVRYGSGTPGPGYSSYDKDGENR